MKCQKIVFGVEFNEDNLPIEKKVLKGKVLLEDVQEGFILFKTRKREYVINKRFIISIQDMDEEFNYAKY